VSLSTSFAKGRVGSLLPTTPSSWARSASLSLPLPVSMSSPLTLPQGEMLLSIIQQIALANQSLGGGSIVILSSVPKITLEKLIEAENMNLYGSGLSPISVSLCPSPSHQLLSDVIVRTGLPHLQADLRNVSASAARAVIILADKSSADPDVNIVRTVLSLRGLGAPANGHIVAEIYRSDNEQLVKIVGQEAVETFVTHDIVGRMLLHCARERGLAQVFEQLLGFEGSEFYIQEWPDLVGLTFGEVLYRFEEAVVIGILRSTEGTDGPSLPILNPANELIIESGDRIIVLAEDDDTYQSSSVPLYAASDQDELFAFDASYQPRSKAVERVLIVGWKEPMIGIFEEFNASACQGSEMTVFGPLSLDYRQEVLKPLLPSLDKISVSNIQGNPISRRDLERLPLEIYDSVLILAAETTHSPLSENHSSAATANLNVLQTDSCSLATLLLIRDIQSQRNVRTRGRSSRSIFDDDYVPPPPARLTRFDSDFSEDDICFSPVKAVARKGSVISEITNASTKPLMAVASVTDYVPATDLVSAFSSSPHPHSSPGQSSAFNDRRAKRSELHLEGIALQWWQRNVSASLSHSVCLCLCLS
jgi:ion channel POLLUX/CASTOR